MGTRTTNKNARKEPAVRVTLGLRERHANAARHAGLQVRNQPLNIPMEITNPNVRKSIDTPLSMASNKTGNENGGNNTPPPVGAKIMNSPSSNAEQILPPRSTGVITQPNDTPPEVMHVYPKTPERVQSGNGDIQAPRLLPSPDPRNKQSDNANSPMLKLDADCRALVRLKFSHREIQALKEQGITTLDILTYFSESEMSRLHKSLSKAVDLPILKSKLLDGIRYLGLMNRRLGSEMDVEEVNLDTITEQFEEMQLQKESLHQNEDAYKNISAPEKFRDASKWVTFREGFRNYITGVKGSSGVPIEYVIRIQDAPMLDQIKITYHREII